MEKNKRFEEIDILKSFGIILMVMGHIGFTNIFDYYIHSFHMPMFYIISGYLYKESNLDLSQYACKKAKSLLIPYIIFAIFHLVCFYIMALMLGNKINELPLVSIVWFNTDNMPISGALWFLTSLFFVDIFYYIISGIANKRLRYSIIIVISLMGCIIPYYTRLPWALDTAYMGVGLYAMGNGFKKYTQKIRRGKQLKIGIIALIIGSILTFINGYINVRQGRYSNIILYYVVAILMTYGLYVIAKQYSKYDNFFIKELKFIGKNSLVYVCLNQIVLLIPNKILTLVDNKVVLLGGKVSVLVCSLIILHILVLILNKKKLRWILGKI